MEITIDDFDRIHRQVPVLANVKSTGRYPVDYFWYAGGVPALMLELRDMLHLDCLTVTGKTLARTSRRSSRASSSCGNGSASADHGRARPSASESTCPVPALPMN